MPKDGDFLNRPGGHERVRLLTSARLFLEHGCDGWNGWSLTLGNLSAREILALSRSFVDKYGSRYLSPATL